MISSSNNCLYTFQYLFIAERLVVKTKLYWKIELRFRLPQAISSFEVATIKPESFSFPPVTNRFFRISTVPQLECRGIDSSNTSIRHVTAIVPFICLEFRTFRSQTNQNPDLASFLKWSHYNRSNDGTQMDSTLERHHGRLFQIRSQRCDWNQSGQSDTLLNSSRFRQHRQPRKKCWLIDCASIILSIIQQSEHYFKLLFQFSTAGIIRAFMRWKQKKLS